MNFSVDSLPCGHLLPMHTCCDPRLVMLDVIRQWQLVGPGNLTTGSHWSHTIFFNRKAWGFFLVKIELENYPIKILRQVYCWKKKAEIILWNGEMPPPVFWIPTFERRNVSFFFTSNICIQIRPAKNGWTWRTSSLVWRGLGHGSFPKQKSPAHLETIHV